MSRLEHRLEKYDLDQDFDLAIIGGGINGAGVARDAAQRGLKVLLLEKNDFASGCSSHSTRLIHGGLRYLEHFEFSLVYESLQEREILLHSYPHLISPLGLMIPAYKGNKNPLWKLNIGMLLYDFLSQGKSLPNYKNLDLEELEELDFSIKHNNLLGGVYYQDGHVPFAERLVLENILTAEEHGAICINHAEVTDIYCNLLHGEYHAQSLRFKDLINGKRPFTIRAKNIINMAGPWVDKVNLRFKDQKESSSVHNPDKFKLEKRIGGTKGSHIVVKKFPGAPHDFGIYNEAKSDGRPFFITPFQIGANDELYMIGTTDLFLEADDNLDDLKISNEEIHYLIDETNNLFSNADLNEKDIVKTYIGVRPLPKADNKKAGKVSRKHFVINHLEEKIHNYYSVVGGKLTTFRSLAKEITDMFSQRECKTNKTRTVNSRFPSDLSFYDYIGDQTKILSEKYDIEASTVIHLLLLYGTNAAEVLKLCKENPLLKEKIDPNYADIEAQIVYAIRYEKAFSVEDILNRRISIGLCTDQNLESTIKTIKYHLTEEFELDGRQRDKIFQEYLFGDKTQ